MTYIPDLYKGLLTSVIVFFYDLDIESLVLLFIREVITLRTLLVSTIPIPYTNSSSLPLTALTPPLQAVVLYLRTENTPIQPIQTINLLLYIWFSSVEANNIVFNSMPSIATNTTAIGQTIGAKLISEIAKQYTNNKKFTRADSSSFDYKLGIFLDICQRVELLQESVIKAFLIILKGLVLQFFYNNRLAY